MLGADPNLQMSMKICQSIEKKNSSYHRFCNENYKVNNSQNYFHDFSQRSFLNIYAIWNYNVQKYTNFSIHIFFCIFTIDHKGVLKFLTVLWKVIGLLKFLHWLQKLLCMASACSHFYDPALLCKVSFVNIYSTQTFMLLNLCCLYLFITFMHLIFAYFSSDSKFQLYGCLLLKNQSLILFIVSISCFQCLSLFSFLFIFCLLLWVWTITLLTKF